MDRSLPGCAVIIPTYNGGGLTAACVDALLDNPPADCRQAIVVVDDGSTDDSRHVLARFGSQIELLAQDTNQGFARTCNLGARAAAGYEYLVFLNNDTLPTRGWLDALVHEAQDDPEIAAVGAKLLFPNGLIQHAGVAIGQDRWPHHLYTGFSEAHPAVNRSRDVSAVTAACMLVRTADFNAADGFDPAYHNGYEDVDLCLRLGQRGRRIRYCHRSVVYHLESVTRWPDGMPPREAGDAAAVYEERWHSRVTPDDVQHYLDDGLISVSYGPYYPLRVTVTPELGVVTRDGETLEDMDRLVAQRAEQVMELLSIETRRRLAARGSSVTPSLAAARPVSQPTRVAEGTVHTLGNGSAGPLISVLLPVKDGGPFLRELLPLLLEQEITARLEIVAVDSGSRDDSIEVLSAHGATVLSIDPAEFNHGLTRNLAAESARGEVLVLLSQRSRPVSNHWLAPLIAALGDPTVVGVCSRVLPRPDADILTRRDGERELSGSTERQRKQIGDWNAYREMSAHERRVFLNFHTVSAAIRADAWRRTPFRPVRTLGEDLLWAREVVEGGWALVHEPASCVHHSHAYSIGEWFARNVDDGVANRDINGRAFAEAEILPQIRGLATDDWAYLREAAGLSGPELEHWQLEAVLRRTAQAVGQWLGTNYETLPQGTAARFSSVSLARAAEPLASGESP